MVASIALYKIFGLPVIAYGGMFTMLLLLIAAILGTMVLKGNTKISVKCHVNLARIALILGIVHGIVGVMLFL